MKSIPRILVLDDDANLRKTLVDILRLKGYEVVASDFTRRSRLDHHLTAMRSLADHAQGHGHLDASTAAERIPPA